MCCACKELYNTHNHLHTVQCFTSYNACIVLGWKVIFNQTHWSGEFSQGPFWFSGDKLSATHTHTHTQTHTHTSKTSMHVLYGKHMYRLGLNFGLGSQCIPLSSYTCMEENKLLMFVNRVYTFFQSKRSRVHVREIWTFKTPIASIKIWPREFLPW